jgi:hypothetical protein
MVQICGWYKCYWATRIYLRHRSIRTLHASASRHFTLNIIRVASEAGRSLEILLGYRLGVTTDREDFEARDVFVAENQRQFMDESLPV